MPVVANRRASWIVAAGARFELVTLNALTLLLLMRSRLTTKGR